MTPPLDDGRTRCVDGLSRSTASERGGPARIAIVAQAPDDGRHFEGIDERAQGGSLYEASAGRSHTTPSMTVLSYTAGLSVR